MLATRQLGHQSADIPAAELAHSAEQRLNYKDDSFAELLQQIEAALHNPELAEADALELVQQLNRHTQGFMRQSEIDSAWKDRRPTLHADRVPGAHARTN